MSKSEKQRRPILSLLLVLALCLGMFPTAFAAQGINYYDPADRWVTSSNRTNELDSNAIVSRETFHCCVCDKDTIFAVYRTPEYSRDGASALSRNVMYSDGTKVDETGKGYILDGTPNVDARYTGYHWTKAVCETCGTINSNMGAYSYIFRKNIYRLNDCATEFFQDIPEVVSYEYTDNRYHNKTTAGGEYCIFCFGTYKAVTSKLERHDLNTTTLTQLANQRFVEVETCADCGYTHTGYAAAKAVVTSYYGVADGRPHTLTVSDLSDSGVSTAIRYGNSAESCTLASAPNYTEAGQYTVYYEITYTYKNTSMTENGVAYVWLHEESTGKTCPCGCGDPDCGCANQNCGGNCCKGNACGDNHRFVLLDSVKASCLTLGYDRYLCTECGKIEKRDYTNALGHSWQGVVVRDATCEDSGKLFEICARCGEVKATDTPKGEHSYKTYSVTATCTAPGYTVRECTVCGDRQITDVTSALPHDYKTAVTPASCEAGGSTLHLCAGCGSSFVTDYTDALGHSWDNGTTVTDATCGGEGVTEYHCTRCGYHRLEGDAAQGHTPGDPATCTAPQTCTQCGAVLKNALGHDYKGEATAPTCEKMGYTTFTCSRCGDSYKGEYADATGHKLGDWITDKEPTTDSEGSRHKECESCGKTLETEATPKLYLTATTDTHGEAVVGGYLVIVTDTDTKNPVSGAGVALDKAGSISIRLPNSRLLDYADQTTVTVLLVKDKAPVPDMQLAVTDKNGNYCADKTDKAGQLTVPGTSGSTNGDGKATGGYEDADGERFTLTVKVEHTETGRPIEGAGVSIGRTGKITVVLPDGVDMDERSRITVTVTDHKKQPQEGLTVLVKGDLKQTAEGKTDENGKLTVPAVAVTERHGAYIYGYQDGAFGPERNMTRSEAAAIFARLLADKNGDTITAAAKTKFSDIPANSWYSGYVKYLTSYGIAYGCGDNRFAPDRAITRAEFTAMAVRFFDAYGEGADELMEKYSGFDDVSSGYWVAEYIRDAALHGWIFGYGDGTFRGERSITRAEVVAIVNRLLGRTADEEYITANLRRLNTFTDMDKRHWAYYDVMEAANSHNADMTDTEEWGR
ncbi:MAG: S-layer homology domain-containing protein [Acutalibacter sp.]|nr:S-layer homology domain-containing protein [Acutalibacter sp.]